MAAGEDRARLRERFLRAIYDATVDKGLHTVNMWDLGRSLGLDTDTIGRIVDYLDGEDYLGQGALGGWIALSHSGVKAAERLQGGTGSITESHTALTVNYVGSVVNSQIQMGTNASTQSIYNEISLDAVRNFAALVLEHAAQLPLSPDVQRALIADATTVTAQVDSPAPKKSILAECLSSMRSILEQVAGNVIAQKLLMALSNLS